MKLSKRVFDLVGASAGLFMLAPLFAAISLAIKLDDGGPVFFRQERVGKGGQVFSILKFRTMLPGASGPAITVEGDARVTRLGRLLRSWKLDELPQLINVIRGEMSLVGPRPEVARYVARYQESQRRVLDLVPGITDPASVAFRKEGLLLMGAADPEQFYIEEIMPEKVRLNLEYAARATTLSDAVVLCQTVFNLYR